jgi:hypothetical protein
MTPIQDIDVVTEKGTKLRIEIRRQPGGSSVSLQELLTSGSFAGAYFPFSSPHFVFGSSQLAFEYAIKALRVFLKYADDDVAGVNNPCNCELLHESLQQAVLAALSLGITVTVSR